jgi:hypothetical protein
MNIPMTLSYCIQMGGWCATDRDDERQQSFVWASLSVLHPFHSSFRRRTEQPSSMASRNTSCASYSQPTNANPSPPTDIIESRPAHVPACCLSSNDDQNTWMQCSGSASLLLQRKLSFAGSAHRTNLLSAPFILRIAMSTSKYFCRIVELVTILSLSTPDAIRLPHDASTPED